MSTLDIIKYYVDLLIIQYIGKPKARATIDAVVKQAVMDQLPIQIENAFDIDTAVGAQLNIIGKYVGVTRSVQSFNTQIILNDNEFRLLIKMAIIKNSSGSSLSEIQNLMWQFFPGEVYAYDYLGMRMSYFIDSTAFSSNLVQAVIEQDLLPYPMAVQRGAVIYGEILTNFYGFRTYSYPAVDNSPFNTYEDYQMDWPWLTYEDALSPDTQIEYSLLTENGIDILVQQDGDGMYI